MDGLIIRAEIEEEEALIAEIEEEMRKIYLSVELLHNNPSPSDELTDPVDKSFISNYCFASTLLETGISDVEPGKDILQSFEEGLQKELDFLTSDMDRLLIKMKDYKEKLNSLDRNISNIRGMIETQENASHQKKNLNQVMQNVTKRFRKEKADLKTIVASIFPESLEIQDIFARVVSHHFDEGTDKYVQLEDSSDIMEQIELLRRTRLIETNPDDPLQVRLADLV